MATPLELLANFFTAKTEGDDKNAQKLRGELLKRDLDTEEAISAVYRLALYTLFQERNLNSATHILHDLANTKLATEEALHAHIGYGIALWKQGKPQQAILEMRRIVTRSKSHAAAHATALDFLSVFLHDAHAGAETIRKIDQERIEQLQELAKLSKDPDEKAIYELRLAAALEEQGQKGDLKRVRELVAHAAKVAASATPATRSIAKDAQKRIRE